MNDMIFDNEYTGPRYTYALRNRPPSIGCCPTGRIVGADKPHPDWMYGTITYARELTDKEIYDYELVQLQPLRKGHIRIKYMAHGNSHWFEYIIPNTEEAMCGFFHRGDKVQLLEGDAQMLRYVAECFHMEIVK
jgi:hypothetical protein